MCGRYTLTRQDGLVEDLEAALDPAAPANPWWKARYNISPTQDAPVVTLRDGARTLEMMRWGLVPFWAEPGKKLQLMINARVESLMAKQFFRDALERKRCLVPANGFFEWVRGGYGGKQAPRPFYFHPPGPRLIAFAGLWARHRDPRGDELHSFTIITTRANPLVKPIHDRMPIVLPPEDHAAWLSPDLDADAARALLGHPAGDHWRSDPVSTWVNKADHDDPRCIAPETAPDASRQQRLF